MIHAWGPVLNARPLAVLIKMALTALDDAVTPRFFGGWDVLATAAGHATPESCARCRGCKACLPARRAVTKSLEALLAMGAITRTRRASRGRTAEYRLWLDHPAPVDDPTLDTLPIDLQPP